MRNVEGSGFVDYLNCIWCIDSSWGLYSQVSEAHGLAKHPTQGIEWDAFWYIYRRDQEAPSYSHIGLDLTADLNQQSHVCSAVTQCIDEAHEIEFPDRPSSSLMSCFGR